MTSKVVFIGMFSVYEDFTYRVPGLGVSKKVTETGLSLLSAVTCCTAQEYAAALLGMAEK